MSLTGAQLLQGFSEFIGDYIATESTANGGSLGTTVTSSALRKFGDDYLRDFYIRVTGDVVTADQYEVRRITNFSSATGTCTIAPSLTVQPFPNGNAFEVHRYDPEEKFKALDAARPRVIDSLFKIVHDDTLTGDGRSRVFDIPSSVRFGPTWVYEEVPIGTDVEWNFLTSAEGDSLDGWTASSTTASLYTEDFSDLVVPKYGTSSTKLVTAASTAATYTQAVADMTTVTASLAADRKMTFGRWVYCTEASKVRVGITDDVNTTYSSYHGGNGWELLTVEKTIAGNNATTLSAVVDIASTANASTIYVDRCWFYFGSAERITEVYDMQNSHRIERDDTLQRIILPFVPNRGHQLRLVGKAMLSALGTTASTQVTNTMEVDEENAEILYAEAAEILFVRVGMNLTDVSEMLPKIAEVRARRNDASDQWKMKTKRRRMRSMWAR